MSELQHYISNVEIVPDRGGKFEVTVNGDLVYSKLETGRHAEEKEILNLVREKYVAMGGVIAE